MPRHRRVIGSIGIGLPYSMVVGENTELPIRHSAGDENETTPDD